ncbi:MAG: ABC transporter permease [Acidimicrobiales bacterium]
MLERLSLADAADKLVDTNSGGMRRRLDLGASLAGRPRLLLLDEPTTDWTRGPVSNSGISSGDVGIELSDIGIERPSLEFTFVGPVVFVVLLDVVFGGSVATGDLNYIDFLIPGVLVQTAVFDGTSTAIALPHDIQNGSLDRFTSLPIRRSAVLIGRKLADLVRVTATALVVLGVGFLLGFRASEGLAAVVASVALAVAFGHTFHWAYAYFGLTLKDPTVVQSAGFLPIFPLVFAASTFAPVENMPGWLQPFSEHQPVTVTVDAVRAIMHGGDVAEPLTQSLLWIAGLLALWATLATRALARGMHR